MIIFTSLLDVDLSNLLDGTARFLEKVGWERGIFFLVIAFLEWRAHRQYKRNIDDKQLQIDRLEREKDQLLTRLTKLLDRKHNLKPPVK